MVFFLFCLGLLCFATAADAQDQAQCPILSGYVTRAASGSDFDVNWTRILCDQETRTEVAGGNSYTASGVILVPHQVVDRMRTDSQLAEILADAIARTLEKQSHSMGCECHQQRWRRGFGGAVCSDRRSAD